MASVAVKAAAAAPHKLHLVRLVRSPIRNPESIRNTLKALGLHRRNQTVIHKNTSAVNGQLAKVLHLVDVRPVVFDAAASRIPGAPLVGDDGVVRGFTEEQLMQSAERIISQTTPTQQQ
ncbi:uncharacterized protein MONBRDRAFT_30785 [Monosiga brevicollis MX1]|uniref:Large ribosomal subunit protein uL30m n=1 Tax=Monosiga brevicollis TaxID=81824 RepID=A9UP79_MONBE|nr:uncharacterized protein MONBRDRAFT_30785 [Monosiga brevicollis MX1]EDQ92373.1 predicted protein [Monosiga brevicollis MX1]|eukprot:XP_001742135.1 hypothetical protein [Monosiga brevicollis MX1]